MSRLSKQQVIGTLFIALLGMIVIFGWWKYWGASSAPSSRDLAQLATDSDFTQLAQQSGVALQSARNAKEKDWALNAKAYADFMQGSPAMRAEAVRVVRQRYELAQIAEHKARALNQIIMFVTVGRTPAVYDEVFQNPPFDTFARENYSSSIAAVAQESYRLYPSVVAASYSVMGDIAALTNWDRHYELTQEERKAHVQAIIDALPRVEDGYKRDQKLDPASPLVDLPEYSYLHWKAILYSRIASEDATYSDKTKAAYKTLFDYYDSQVGADGHAPSILELRIPEDHFLYARFLVSLGGVDNITEAQAHLSALMHLISFNPSLHERGYVNFFRSVASGKSTTQDRDLRIIKLLTDADPLFGDFLKQYGIGSSTSTASSSGHK